MFGCRFDRAVCMERACFRCSGCGRVGTPAGDFSGDGLRKHIECSESVLHEPTRQLCVVTRELYTSDIRRVPARRVDVVNHAMVSIERFDESCEDEVAPIARIDVHSSVVQSTGY